MCPTLCHPMDYSLPGSSIHGILQARILEWVVISFSWGFSWPRDQTWVSCIAGRFFTIWATREALKHWWPIFNQICLEYGSYYSIPSATLILLFTQSGNIITRLKTNRYWFQNSVPSRPTEEFYRACDFRVPFQQGRVQEPWSKSAPGIFLTHHIYFLSTPEGLDFSFNQGYLSSHTVLLRFALWFCVWLWTQFNFD